MKTWAKRILTLTLALCLVLAMTACGQKEPAAGGEGEKPADEGKTYNLVFTTHLPETGVDGASLKYFLEEVTKETGGRVTFETYFGGSMTKSGETLEAASNGLADIAFVPEGFYESQFYPLFVAMLPYSTTSEWVCNMALKEMFETYEPFTEMCKKQGVVNLGPIVPSEVVMVSTDKAINTLEDLQGLKIRAMGAVNNEMKLLGATPVAMDASEIYEALERDTVAAATGIPVTLAVSYKLQEVADYFIFSGIGTYTTSSLYMNEDTWNSLPADIQDAFGKVYDRFVDEYSGDDWMGGDLKAAIKAIKDAGATVIALDEAEQEKWAEKLVSCEQEFIKKANDYGYNGQEILDTYRALVEKYEPQDIAYQVY